MSIYLTINFIWAVVNLFWTIGSEVISKCGLSIEFLTCEIVFLYASSLSLELEYKAFFNDYVYCKSDPYCWAVTIAFIWATSAKGLDIKAVNILGSVKISWLRVIGSFGFLS